ncbi:MAG: protein translocase subunit SecDF, partial [Metamycoplasma salivarium]
IIVLTLGFLLITYSQLNINVLDALILANVFVAYDTAINNSMLNFELKKDLNTKNFVYTDSKLEEIFKKHTIDMFSRQIALLAIGIVLIPLILTLMTTTNKTLVLTLSYSIISLFFVNMFLIPMIKLSIFKAKYRLKAKRIENKYWQSKSVEEQMFIGINDYAM